MREIKFRAWDTKERRMFVPFELKQKLNQRLGQFSADIILLQYTGLKDKNGIEIYEGDIVRHYDYPYLKAGGISTVKWNVDACGFYPFTEEIADYGHPSAGEWIEVIGNIYANPELLKGQDNG